VAPYGQRVDEGATQVLLLAQVYGGILGSSERALIASFACRWIGGKSMKTFRDAEENPELGGAGPRPGEMAHKLITRNRDAAI
jgi:hypothetical protein